MALAAPCDQPQGVVRSARAVGTLKPYCIFSGNQSSPIAEVRLADRV